MLWYYIFQFFPLSPFVLFLSHILFLHMQYTFHCNWCFWLTISHLLEQLKYEKINFILPSFISLQCSSFIFVYLRFCLVSYPTSLKNFNSSHRAVLLPMNSLQFRLLKNTFIYTSLCLNFSSYRILSWQLFSFNMSLLLKISLLVFWFA